VCVVARKSYGSSNDSVPRRLTARKEFDEIFCCFHRKRKAGGLKPPALTQRVLN